MGVPRWMVDGAGGGQRGARQGGSQLRRGAGESTQWAGVVTVDVAFRYRTLALVRCVRAARVVVVVPMCAVEHGVVGRPGEGDAEGEHDDEESARRCDDALKDAVRAHSKGGPETS